MAEDLKSILDELLVSAFPDLRMHDITIEFKKTSDGMIEMGRLTDEGYYVEVDKPLRKASRVELMGGIAHELCHIVRDAKETFVEKLLYRFSRRYREAIERDIDLEVILRGYGRHLLAFSLLAGKKWNRYREDGLAPREIASLIESTTSGKTELPPCMAKCD